MTLALPVPLPMAIAIYFTIWWIALFVILPIGVHSQEEAGSVTQGTEPGAPASANMWKKALWTTGLATLLFIGLMLFLALAP